MAVQYQLKMPGIVYSGENSLEHIAEICRGHKRATVFTDKGICHSGLTDRPVELLKKEGLEVTILDELPAEPTCDQAQKTVEAFREKGADLIVAIGGGSVMDAAKLASVTATDRYTVRDWLKNPMLAEKSVKTLMIPTTAGTGAEATPNSIVAVPEEENKVGIVNPLLIPDSVILDGNMIKKLPKKIAAATGIDALAHALECYTSKKANPFSDLFAMEALKLIFENLIPACEDENAMEAKNKMLLAAFYGGVAITASGTTAVHALAYPLGGKYHIPHGVSNAMMLLPVMRFNEMECIPEFVKIHDSMGEDVRRTSEEKGNWLLRKLEYFIKELEIPSDLKEFGVGREDLTELVTAGMEVQRLLVNNKRPVTEEDARRLYLEIMP